MNKSALSMMSNLTMLESQLDALDALYEKYEEAVDEKRIQKAIDFLNSAEKYQELIKDRIIPAFVQNPIDPAAYTRLRDRVDRIFAREKELSVKELKAMDKSSPVK